MVDQIVNVAVLLLFGFLISVITIRMYYSLYQKLEEFFYRRRGGGILPTLSIVLNNLHLGRDQDERY